MAKIINAKSQKRIYLYDGCNRYIAQLSKRNGAWGLKCINSRIDNADLLRKIADKLDKLNGVELPQFLKEQA